MRWGGGGTPSIDEPDKAYPQPEPVKTDVIIQDDQKVNWNDVILDKISDGLYTNLLGSGTQADPYVISNEDDIAYLSYLSQSNTFQNKYFLQTQDIELNDGWFEDDGTYHDGGDGKLYEWTPIGNLSYFFQGIYDGGSHKISGLYINDGGYCRGFIGCGKCTINNLTIDKTFISAGEDSSGNSSTGGFVGMQCNKLNEYAIVILNNCEFNGVVTATGNYVGGFVGSNGNTFVGANISSCINRGKVYGNNFVAGFISRASWTTLIISQSINEGDISGTDNVAGFLGGGNGTATKKISFCNNKGKISSSSGNAAGLSNSSDVSFSDCENYAEIFSNSGNVFGICKSGKADNCKNYGKLIGKDAFGVTSSSANNCENRGEIFATGTACGVGGSATNNYINCANYGNIMCHKGCGIGNGIIKNCINYGNIVGKENIGGVSLDSSSGENCINYGILITKQGFAGGIVATRSGGWHNCHNNGNVLSQNGTAGGVVCWTYGSAKLTNCSNKGTISGYNAGGLIGRTAYDSSATISYCDNFGNVIATNWAGGIVGSNESGNGKLYFYSCSNRGMCKGNYVGQFYANLDNSRDIQVNQFVGYGILVGTTKMGIIGNSGGNRITLDNVLISCEVTGKINDLPASVNKKNIIVDCKNENSFVKRYWGDNFDAFFVKWKTGYIGLKALESAGVYMFAIPDDEYLKERGFEKIA